MYRLGNSTFRGQFPSLGRSSGVSACGTLGTAQGWPGLPTEAPVRGPEVGSAWVSTERVRGVVRGVQTPCALQLQVSILLFPKIEQGDERAEWYRLGAECILLLLL
jgi:hypothetical protein